MKNLFAVQDSLVISYDLATAIISTYSIDVLGVKSLKAEANRLFVLKENKLEIYQEK